MDPVYPVHPVYTLNKTIESDPAQLQSQPTLLEFESDRICSLSACIPRCRHDSSPRISALFSSCRFLFFSFVFVFVSLQPSTLLLACWSDSNSSTLALSAAPVDHQLFASSPALALAPLPSHHRHYVRLEPQLYVVPSPFCVASPSHNPVNWPIADRRACSVDD